MFERKKKELVERLINNQDDKFYYSLEKMFEYMGKGTCLGISSHGNIEDIKKIENEELFSYFKEFIKGVEWKGTDHFIGAAVIVGICIYFIGVSFQHGYELQKEADEIL